MPLSIRRARPADVPVILALIRGLAVYEREPDAVVATEEDLLRDGFGPSPAFEVLLAEDAGEAIGFAFYFFSYSTWRGRRCLYLEDLFVAPDARGQGAARRLIEAVGAAADAAGASSVYWHTQEFNADARALYDTLASRTSFIVYQRFRNGLLGVKSPE